MNSLSLSYRTAARTVGLPRMAPYLRPFTTQKGLNKDACPFKDKSSQPEWCGGKKLPSETLLEMENKYAAHNYHPIPVVCSEAEGLHIWDPEGRKYMDFLSAYSAVNQGHGHPRILQALHTQSKRLCLSSRAFHNDMLPRFAKYIHEYFGYDQVLPMNTGAEGVETAIKIARRWGYNNKNVEDNDGIIISAKDCFHGRTILAISLSDDDDARTDFGPFVPNIKKVEYNNLQAMKKMLEKYSERVVGVILEPIQGEAGVVVPDSGYLKAVHELCKQHKCLFIADEIQTGLARTGKMLCVDWDDMRPDVVILGKALSGGMYPVSCVLADHSVMQYITPGSHGSTYGGNPLACAIAITALEVLKDEQLDKNALKMGEIFRNEVQNMSKDLSFVKEVRGRGLLNAVEIDSESKVEAWNICMEMKERGLLAKPTHDTIIRFAPPLVIKEDQMSEALDVIRGSFKKFA